MHQITGIFAFVIACVLLLIRRTDASYGLDTALIQASKADPFARNDTLQLLRPSLKLLLSSTRHDIEQKMHSILSLQSTTLVTVKLVGFSSDQKHQLELQLGRYLEVLNKNEYVHVIGTGGSSNHRLNVKSKIAVEVVRAENSLSDRIFKAIQGLIEQPSSFSSIYHQPIPYTVVDDIVQADLQKPLTSYVIYILNLKHQTRSYGYDYQPGDSDNLHAAFTKCLGSFWMGKDRYIWIDLAAGPMEYGPGLSGDGLILKSDIYPYAAAFHGESPVQKALLADLASLVWSASQMLFAPAIRIPVYYDAELEVHFYHIKSPGAEDVNWKDIETSLNTDGVFLQGQSLVFKQYTIDLDSCALCSALISRSTKSYASRVLLERYSLFVTDYIDSKQLHYLLGQNQEELEKVAGVKPSMNRVVPVYIFDLDTDRILMLDRDHQAMAFREMVVSVRTKGYQTVTEFNCNNRPVVVHTKNIVRPIVASLVQTLWGVTPTHLTWSSQHNSTLVDYTWSLGQTPFGPFSELSSLSFVQRDAAPRNVLYTMLNTTVWGAVEVLKSVKDFGGEKALLRRNGQQEFNLRWNFMIYKLNKATSAISHFDFNLALFFIRSAEHDLFSIHQLVFEASTHLEASMVCFTDPPFPWHWLLLAMLVSGIGIYVWLRREQLFVNKRKRF